ncbi:DNA replication and repair protein RecF [Candidatus Saccharibacteria bacterium]|nr:DNA replication and repair protein RecF [Candidatus Saccharibacteria bacterium]
MIQGVRLQQFRSYTDSSYEFERGVNIIVGPNASGKTNLIEALLVASQGGSYRAADQDLVQHGCDWARIDLFGDEQTLTTKLILQPKPDKQFEIAGKTQKTLRFDQITPVVLFEPNNLQLLTQSPELRRGYLDDVIAKIDRSYGTLLRSYRRTLAQRNRLLKQPNVTNDMYFVWNVRLCELGGQLALRRDAFVKDNAALAERQYNNLVDKTHKVSLVYQSVIPMAGYSEHMLRELDKRLPVDQQRGFTTLGPHRDDLIIRIDDHDLSLSASRGETRTIVLAMKLVELEVVETARGQRPIMLLDDVFSELDGARRKNLTTVLKEHQSFITTTDADVVVHHFLGDCNVITTG